MQTPTLSIATRLRCSADDLRSLKVWLPQSFHLSATRIAAELEFQAERLESAPSPAPTKQPTRVGDSSASAGAGVSFGASKRAGGVSVPMVASPSSQTLGTDSPRAGVVR